MAALNLLRKPAHEMAELLASREVSSRELTEATLARIEATDPTIRAFLTVTPDLALSIADECDQARARGEKLGPLAGVPIAVKDNMCVRGVLCTCASKILANYEAVYDATVVERLKAAHMPIVG